MLINLIKFIFPAILVTIFTGCTRQADERISSKPFLRILENQELRALALREGKRLFESSSGIFNHECSWCHGAGGRGSSCPSLRDSEWIWGGELDEIFKTIRVGVRELDKNGLLHPDTRNAIMPEFRKILSSNELEDVSKYVLELSEKGVADGPGLIVYQDHCSACHGINAEGKTTLGAPPLNNRIWRDYAHKRNLKDYIAFKGYAETTELKTNPHNKRRPVAYRWRSSMPAWGKYYNDASLRALTIYVWCLGKVSESVCQHN